jgi:hypothetical protein
MKINYFVDYSINFMIILVVINFIYIEHILLYSCSNFIIKAKFKIMVDEVEDLMW